MPSYIYHNRSANTCGFHMWPYYWKLCNQSSFLKNLAYYLLKLVILNHLNKSLDIKTNICTNHFVFFAGRKIAQGFQRSTSELQGWGTLHEGHCQKADVWQNKGWEIYVTNDWMQSWAGVGSQLNLHRDTQRAGKKPDILLCYCTQSIWFSHSNVLPPSQGLYGTRNMGALSVKTSGEVSFYERYIENTNWKEHVFQYHVQQL